jgi:hypothetical protein
MKRIVSKPLTAAILVLLASAWIDGRSAKPKPQNTWTPACVAYVPPAWGDFKGGTQQSGLAFQDDAGTLRFVTNIPCNGTPAPVLEIRRTPVK